MFRRVSHSLALFTESVFVGFSFAIGWVLAMSLLTLVLI